jgi:hypothetical protein
MVLQSAKWCSHLLPNKMMDYRDAAAEDWPASPFQAPVTEDLPTYMNLGVQYGLTDEMDIGNPSISQQTIEQEYQAYVTAALTAKSMPILTFWEVMIVADNNSTYH